MSASCELCEGIICFASQLPELKGRYFQLKTNPYEFSGSQGYKPVSIEKCERRLEVKEIRRNYGTG